MYDALRNALVIEVRDLFAQDEVFEQRRTAQARLERILVVRNGHALIGRERATAGVDANAIERAVGGLKLICGLPLPTFGEAFVSVSVLPETRGCGGSTVWPAAGVRAASPNSLGLAALKGNCDATSSVAASFAVAASWMADTPDDGPLTVDRALEAPA